MSQALTSVAAGPAGRPLGVMEAVGRGWRLLMSDFWRLWLTAGLLWVIVMGASQMGLLAAVLVQPPMLAGLYYVVSRRIDGVKTGVGDVFAGFSHRFGQSIVALLPLMIASLVVVLGMAAAAVLGVVGGAGIAAAAEGEEEVVAVSAVVLVVVLAGLWLLAMVALLVFSLFLHFVMPAVWDHPESGWEAAKASMGLVRERFFPVLGLAVLFWLINHAAMVVGLGACCIGVFVTMPAVMIWSAATTVYLYRSWTGRVGSPVAESG